MKRKRLSKKRLRFEALEGRQMLSAVTVLPAGGGIAAEAASSSAAHYLSTSAEISSHSSSASATATTSSNWGGYAVQTISSDPVDSVTGSWVVPTVTGTGTTYSALWVGIDGYSSSTVEQIGTEQDVVNGKASYSAWWEMYPSGSNTISKITVNAGDTITASVTYQSATSNFLLTISDSPKGGGAAETYSTTQALASQGRTRTVAQRSSAEWIIEAPSNGYSILPLANFGTASFSEASATLGTTTQTTSGATGPINDAAWAGSSLYSINIVSNSGATIETTGATTAAPNGGLTDTTNSSGVTTSSFSVTYDTATPVTPSPSPSPAPSPSPSPTPPPSHHHGGGGWWGWSTKAVSQITIGLGDQATDNADSPAAKDALKARDGIFASIDWLSLQAARV
jgi:hypothetical protein